MQQEYTYKYRRVAAQAQIDFIDTYSAAYRRQPFVENQGFEESMPAAQDAEFSFRLARKGYRLVFAPQASVYHFHSVNLRQYARRKYRNGYWRLFMSRWLPEKTFSNSHTPPTMHWQIMILGLEICLIPLSIIWPPLAWLLIPGLILFLVTALPFLKHIWRNDRPVFWIAPILLLLRAGALGVGVAHGLVAPPRSQPRTYTGLSRSERFFKRALDILGSLIGLIIFSPILFVSAVAIKLNTPGPVFFRQKRSGENGKPFDVFKLRTMVDGADEFGKQLGGDPFDGMVLKIPDDPRVTHVGRFLRRWSIDEIPQFWNVLKGEMSLVGPRPEQTWVVAQYNDEQRLRLAVKPGITGPMQIGGRAELDMEARQVLEVEYINTYSLLADIKILLHTIPAVINGNGAL